MQPVADPNFDACSTENRLQQAYGPMMTAGEVAGVLKLRSRQSLNMARARGSVPLDPLQIPGRREFFYRTSDVAKVLTNWLTPPEKEADMYK